VLAAVAFWGVLDHLFIVFANDYADRDHDQTDARTPFSGGSGVLVDGALKPRQLLHGAIGAAVCLWRLSLAFAIRSWWILPLGVAAIALLWLYSFGPRLSYRGGGEFLQGLGVGVVLPLVGFAAQAGQLHSYPFVTLLATFALAFAGNIATALPDRDVDRRAKKKTWPVKMGVARAAWACAGLTLTGIYLALATSGLLHSHGGWLALSGFPLTALPFLRFACRRHVIAFVVLQGMSAQLLLLTWSLAAIA
jgi:1,4-dihydroxy-2-naphthoate octaprenyltransferase